MDIYREKARRFGLFYSQIAQDMRTALFGVGISFVNIQRGRGLIIQSN